MWVLHREREQGFWGGGDCFVVFPGSKIQWLFHRVVLNSQKGEYIKVQPLYMSNTPDPWRVAKRGDGSWRVAITRKQDKINRRKKCWSQTCRELTWQTDRRDPSLVWQPVTDWIYWTTLVSCNLEYASAVQDPSRLEQVDKIEAIPQSSGGQ